MSTHLLNLWYQEYGVNHHHLHSFNIFIEHGLRNIIQSSPISFTTSKNIEVQIFIDNIFVPNPFIYDETRKKTIISPLDSRRMNLTYSSPVYISIVEVRNGVKTYYDRIILAHLPIMVRSKCCILYKQATKFNECENDPGGYFIINGIDRILVTQQRNNYNAVFVSEDKNGYRAEIRSMSEDTNHSVLTQATLTSSSPSVEQFALKTIISFSLPHVKSNVLLSTIMLAFNVKEEYLLERFYHLQWSERDYTIIKNSIQYMFRLTAQQHNAIDQASALEYIGSIGTKTDSNTNLKEYASQILHMEMFPHLGVFSQTHQKTELIIYIAFRLYAVALKRFKTHDRDNLMNKRFENSGILLSELFKSLYRSAISDIENEYEKNINLVDIFAKIDSTITKNIKYCFATGKWGVQRNAYIRQGVSQVLNRLSFIATISHLQRVVIPIGKEGKNFKIRQIHPSSFGYICLYETPEGQSCGIVLNTTLSTRTSDSYPFAFIFGIIAKNILSISEQSTNAKECFIFLNGVIIGFTNHPERTTEELRKLRRHRRLPADVSIAYDHIENEIRIFCDKGRLIRPFLRCPVPSQEELSNCKTFSEALCKGYVQWLDANEVQSLVISIYPQEKYGDYCELDPSLLLGVCAGAIPFLDHNQSPRNVYESSMVKQAIGMFALNYQNRYESVCHTLDYPQKSLVSTQNARLIGMHKMPAGINCIVAITTHGGWNAEDSIIINRSAIERGLFCSNTYHTYTFEDKTFKSESCKKICIPPLNIQKSDWNYYHLGANGIVRRGAYVKRNDVILGQIYQSFEIIDGEKIETITDSSELCDEEGIIDKTEIVDTPSGNRLIKVIIRQVRIPEVGDKFANMAAQKGTCALVLPQEDLPFTGEGIVPDIMMNSHALPSRMTISMLLEMVLGKGCLLNGELGDATPFSKSSINIVQKLQEQLIKHGFERHGKEIMYNGYTGKPLTSEIFIGTSYYQKLKHMVADKIHARSYGNVTSLTRQPLAGRSRDGGLRLGEMERDCLLSHGSVQFLREKLFDLSDAFNVLICNDCGVISNNKNECHICRNNELIRTNIPYAAKLLFQILNGCLIKTTFKSITK